MEVDRRKFLASIGAGALAVMTPEDKAEALEHYMVDALDGEETRITWDRGGISGRADEAGARVQPYRIDRRGSGAGVGRAIGRLKDLGAAVRRRRRAAGSIEKRIDPELAASRAARSAFFAEISSSVNRW